MSGSKRGKDGELSQAFSCEDRKDHGPAGLRLDLRPSRSSQRLFLITAHRRSSPLIGSTDAGRSNRSRPTLCRLGSKRSLILQSILFIPFILSKGDGNPRIRCLGSRGRSPSQPCRRSPAGKRASASKCEAALRVKKKRPGVASRSREWVFGQDLAGSSHRYD